jgi:flagellar basal body-associated protein FliL
MRDESHRSSLGKYSIFVFIMCLIFVALSVYQTVSLRHYQQQIIANSDQYTNGGTDKMLQLLLSQIESGYTNLTAWTAVLTLVFLVFSFYNIFKIEETKKQIEQYLPEIKAEYKMCKQMIDTIDKASFSTLNPEDIKDDTSC